MKSFPIQFLHRFSSIFGRFGGHSGSENGAKIEEKGVGKNMKNDERKNHEKTSKNAQHKPD